MRVFKHTGNVKQTLNHDKQDKGIASHHITSSQAYCNTLMSSHTYGRTTPRTQNKLRSAKEPTDKDPHRAKVRIRVCIVNLGERHGVAWHGVYVCACARFGVHV